MQSNEFMSFMVELVKKDCDEHRINKDLDIAQCDYRSYFEINKDQLELENSQILLEKFGRTNLTSKESIGHLLDGETWLTLVEEHPESARLNELIDGDPKKGGYVYCHPTEEYVSFKYIDSEGRDHLGFELYINGENPNEIVSWYMNDNQDGEGVHHSDEYSVKGLSAMIKNIDSLEAHIQERHIHLKDESHEDYKLNASKRKPKM